MNKEKFPKLIKSIFKFIGIFASSCFIALIIFLITFLLSLYSRSNWWERNEIVGWVMLSFGGMVVSFTALFYLSEKFRKIFNSILKFIGVCIGSFFIISLFLNLISFLFLFCWPSFFKIYWEKTEIAGLVILGWIVCFTFLFYLSEKFRKIFKPLAIFGLLIGIAILPIRVFLISPFTMKGNQLEPYLKDGQYFFVQKFDKSIKRGDIIMNSDGKLCMVFGLPGEKVEIKEGVIFINDQPLKEINYNLGKLSSHQSITIPEDSFFCFLPNPQNKDWIDFPFYIRKKSEIKEKVFLKF